MHPLADQDRKRGRRRRHLLVQSVHQRAHPDLAPNGSAGTLNSGTLNAIEVDHATGEYFVSIIGVNGEGGGIYVGHLGSLNAPTLWEPIPTFSGGTDSPAPDGFSIDNAPTFSGVTGDVDSALQGGSSLDIVVSDGTDADTDNDKGDGAAITITNAQAGDNLYINAGAGDQQSGTVDGGKVTVAWDSATHTLTLRGTDSFTEYQTLIDDIKYQDSGTDTTTVGSHPTRTITSSVYDGLLSSTVTSAATIAHFIDRAPTLGADSYKVVQSTHQAARGHRRHGRAR